MHRAVCIHAFPIHSRRQAVVFCNTRRKVDWLSEKMKEANFTVSSMHGKGAAMCSMWALVLLSCLWALFFLFPTYVFPHPHNFAR